MMTFSIVFNAQIKFWDKNINIKTVNIGLPSILILRSRTVLAEGKKDLTIAKISRSGLEVWDEGFMWNKILLTILL